jgi:hypothetical protein
MVKMLSLLLTESTQKAAPETKNCEGAAQREAHRHTSYSKQGCQCFENNGTPDLRKSIRGGVHANANRGSVYPQPKNIVR